jgi:hypothetical protein
MQILRWIGKPVLVLLNQLGPPRPAAEERAELERWRAHLQSCAVVRDVLPLDAFARCWVQERVLLDAVAPLLPADRQDAFVRLQAAWNRRNEQRFAQSVRVLAEQLARAAADVEPVDDADTSTAQKVLRTLGVGERSDPAREKAMARLLQRLDADIRESTDRLIALHGLDGSATQTVLARLRENFSTLQKLDEGRAALWSSLVTGALTGLKADLAAGGLTFGAGMLVGGVLGGLAGAGAARGYNKVTGRDRSIVRFAPEFLDGLGRSAVLRYLAVAHFGRGRGRYVEGEAPAFWRGEVERAYAEHAATLGALWQRVVSADAVATREFEQPLASLVRSVLDRLYPDQAGKG